MSSRYSGIFSSVYALEEADRDQSSLEELIDTREEANRTGDYDELYELEDKLVDEAEESSDTSYTDEGDTSSEEESSDESFSTEEETLPGEEAMDELAEQTKEDKENEGESKKSKDNKDSKSSSKEEKTETTTQESSDGYSTTTTTTTSSSTTATESIIYELRSEYYNRLVWESWDSNEVLYTVGSVAGHLVRGAVGVARHIVISLVDILQELGLRYGPVALEGLKKTVVYIFIRAVKSLLKATKAIKEFIKRSESKLKGRLEDLQQARVHLASLKEKGTIQLPEGFLKDDDLSKWFSYGNKVSPTESLRFITKFSEEITAELDGLFTADVTALTSLFSLAVNNRATDPITILKVNNLDIPGMSSVSSENENIEKKIYNNILPNQIRFVTELPKEGLKDIPDIARAYSDSSIYLTPDNRYSATDTPLNYMEPVMLENYISSLERLVRLNLEHINLYRKSIDRLEKLKPGYRFYFESLVKEGKDKKVHDTFVEYIYLKQSFANRVYLPASMDIRDYVSDYITHAVKYIDLNLKSYVVDETEEVT